jgi:hypothetical protein
MQITMTLAHMRLIVAVHGARLRRDTNMSIAQKLAWEIQAQNDHGEAPARQRMALEICYGVSLAQGDPGSFSSTMESIASQVSDSEMQRLLRLYTRRGLK